MSFAVVKRPSKGDTKNSGPGKAVSLKRYLTDPRSYPGSARMPGRTHGEGLGRSLFCLVLRCFGRLRQVLYNGCWISVSIASSSLKPRKIDPLVACMAPFLLRVEV
jgi:hypothetical protein